MNKLELMKTANEIRKGIVTALHSAKAGHPVDLSQQQRFLHTFILKR